MSPKPSRRESCIPEDQVLREAQWHQDRDKLFKLKDEMRKERDAAIDKYLEEKSAPSFLTFISLRIIDFPPFLKTSKLTSYKFMSVSNFASKKLLKFW